MRYLATILFVLFISCPSFASRYYDSATQGLLTPPSTNGPTYHVATTGDDTTGDGSEGNPWATLGKALYRYTNRASGGNGVRILVHTGRYYERPAIPNSWTKSTSDDNRIIVAAAGDGEVILDGSASRYMGTWSVYSGQIYKQTFTESVAGMTAVVVDDDFYSYRPVTTLADVDSEGEWFFDSSTDTLYLYTLAAKGNPSDDTVYLVENDGGSSARYGFSIQDGMDYTTLYGLTIVGSASHGIFDYSGNTHTKIEHCNVSFHAKSGVYLGNDEYAEVTKTKITGNILRNWPRGRWNNVCANINAGGWPAGLGGGGVNNTTVSGCIITDNGGEGTLFYSDLVGGNVWEDNIVGDNWSANIYMDNFPNGVVRRNLIYSSRAITAADVGDHCTTSDEINRVLRRMRPEGVMTADEDYGKGANYEGGQIYDNIIVNCRRGITHYGEATGSAIIDTLVYNNTIITPDSDPSAISDSYAGIRYGYQSGNNTGSVVKNNIVYVRNSAIQGIAWLSSPDPDDNGITWDNNIVYGTTSPWLYKGSSYDLSGWQAASSSNGANSLQSDPDFTGTLGGVSADDYLLSSSSPAKGAGTTTIDGYDFNSFAWLTPASIGALEYGSIYAGAPTPTCSDGIQNGDETGVDCGGSCSACSVLSTTTPLRTGAQITRTGTTPIRTQ